MYFTLFIRDQLALIRSFICIAVALIGFSFNAHAQQTNLTQPCDSLIQEGAYEEACDICSDAFLALAEDPVITDSLKIDVGVKAGYSLTVAGRYAEAFNIYQQLAGCCFDTGNPDSNYLFVVQEMAGLSVLMQSHALVIDQCKEVIRVITYLGGPEDPALVNFYYTIGEKYLTGGNYAGAQQAFTNASEIYLKYHPVHDLIYARIQVELSSAYLSVGNPVKCIELNKMALQILNESNEVDHALRSDAYQLLVWGYNGINNIDSAIYYTGEIIDLSYSLPPFERATALVSSALYIINYDISYGTKLASENGFNSVLLSAQHIYDSIQPEQIYINNLLMAFANYYITIGKFDSTIYYYKKSLDIIQSGYGKKNIIYLNGLATLGRYYEVNEEYAEAAIVYDSLLAGNMQFLQSNFIFLPAGQQESILSSLVVNKDYAFSFYHRHPEFGKRNVVFFENELFMKGLLLQNITSLRNEILGGSDTTSIADFNQWISIKKQLALMSMNNQRDTANLEVKADLMEQKLIGKKKKKEYLNGTGWREISDAMGKHEAAIEYITFENEGTTIYYAALLKNNSKSPELFFLGTSATVDSLLLKKKNETEASFINRIYSFPDPLFPEDSIYDAGEQIYKTIWAPFESQLEEIEKVYIAPSGLLHQIAFAAISTHHEGSLMNRHQITIVSSAKQILQQNEWSGFSNVLLAGGIDYSDSTLYNYVKSAPMLQSVELPRRDAVWTQLPGTYSEIKKTGEQLAAAGISVQLLSGKLPDENRLIAAAAQPTDVLHIATHGYFFNGEDANYSLSGYKFKSSSNPLVRSGLILAGGDYTWVNNRDAEAGNDGILTAEEISNLDLSHIQLIVLSACETGLGDVKGSEGVYGLQRALKMAGVGHIIMSLWQVPDRYTTELMELFYNYLLKGNTPEDSLKKAQLQMQKKTGVYNWGAFILIQ